MSAFKRQATSCWQARTPLSSDPSSLQKQHLTHSVPCNLLKGLTAMQRSIGMAQDESRRLRQSYSASSTATNNPQFQVHPYSSLVSQQMPFLRCQKPLQLDFLDNHCTSQDHDSRKLLLNNTSLALSFPQPSHSKPMMLGGPCLAESAIA